ncbi:unnamed protein product [Protopolystoma xenopodis]|uniref:Uncharacterized protein n=1 Tax=Protopolystoma xenopodis TaxID=117903 RepID=A0A3S5AP33_9PLAT|nr:unnamed protein product [Protopolystoma xenopodis]
MSLGPTRSLVPSSAIAVFVLYCLLFCLLARQATAGPSQTSNEERKIQLGLMLLKNTVQEYVISYFIRWTPTDSLRQVMRNIYHKLQANKSPEPRGVLVDLGKTIVHMSIVKSPLYVGA